MHAKIESVDDARYGQAVEEVHKKFIHFLVVQTEHLFSKVVRFGHVTRFVISSQHHYFFRVVYFESKEIHYNLWSIKSSVNIISQKEDLIVWKSRF